MPTTPVVLITGAAAGIGLAIARLLLEHGDRIVAVDMDEETLANAYAAFDDARVLQVVADIADPVAATRAVEHGVAHFGALDALINNAGLHGAAWGRPALDYSIGDWTKLFAVNVFAIPILAKAARPALAASGGAIVNLSSMVGYGHGASSPYAVSKAAVNGLTIALAGELGKDGIRVVGIAPGFIATDVVLAGLDQQARDRLHGLQTVKGQGTPEDIAEVVAFLISPAARMITATTVIADLGITRRP
ncbi:MAG: NAD(P)-dependent oxidoreductase [Sphingomonas bacterium]|nr:NAD(P)-dependent oxidoreductase [Sphingomonas bacterium]